MLSVLTFVAANRSLFCDVFETYNAMQDADDFYDQTFMIFTDIRKRYYGSVGMIENLTVFYITNTSQH